MVLVLGLCVHLVILLEVLWDREVLVYSLVHAWCSDGRGKDITSVVTAKDGGGGEVRY